MEEQRKLSAVVAIIENMEDFIKISWVDGRINTEVAQELLRMTRKAKDIELDN